MIIKNKIEKNFKKVELFYKQARFIPVPNLPEPIKKLKLKNYLYFESRKTQEAIKVFEEFINKLPKKNYFTQAENFQKILNINTNSIVEKQIKNLDTEIKDYYPSIKEHLHNIENIKKDFNFYSEKITSSVIDFKKTMVVAEKNLKQGFTNMIDYIHEVKIYESQKLKYFWIFGTLFSFLVCIGLAVVIAFTVPR